MVIEQGVAAPAVAVAGRGRPRGRFARDNDNCANVKSLWPVARRPRTAAARGTVASDPPRVVILAIAETGTGGGRGRLGGGEAADRDRLAGEDLGAGGRGTLAPRFARVGDEIDPPLRGPVEAIPRAGRGGGRGSRGRACGRCRAGGRGGRCRGAGGPRDAERLATFAGLVPGHRWGRTGAVGRAGRPGGVPLLAVPGHEAGTAATRSRAGGREGDFDGREGHCPGRWARPGPRRRSAHAVARGVHRGVAVWIVGRMGRRIAEALLAVLPVRAGT